MTMSAWVQTSSRTAVQLPWFLALPMLFVMVFVWMVLIVVAVLAFIVETLIAIAVWVGSGGQ